MYTVLLLKVYCILYTTLRDCILLTVYKDDSAQYKWILSDAKSGRSLGQIESHKKRGTLNYSQFYNLLAYNVFSMAPTTIQTYPSIYGRLSKSLIKTNS